MSGLINRDTPLRIIGNGGEPMSYDNLGRSTLPVAGGIAGGAVYIIPLVKGQALDLSATWFWDAAFAASDLRLDVTDLPELVAGFADVSGERWYEHTDLSAKVPAAAGTAGIDGAILAALAAKRARLRLTVSAEGLIGFFGNGYAR